jgi:hypothetical protein
MTELHKGSDKCRKIKIMGKHYSVSKKIEIKNLLLRPKELVG